jgi:hypothetical protein
VKTLSRECPFPHTFAKWASPQKMKPSLVASGKKGEKKKNVVDE